MSTLFKDKTILVGVTGGIAAYKAAGLCSRLSQLGADVHAVMTEGAKQFVTPLTFQALTHNTVMCDTFQENDPKKVAHIAYADLADLIVVAPLTANTLGKIANGLADNMLTNILLAVSCFEKVLLCPSMNVNMLNNPVTRENLERVQKRGMQVLPPAVGQLACQYVASGKLPDTQSIVNACGVILHL